MYSTVSGGACAVTKFARLGATENWSDAEIIGTCHRKNTRKDNNGTAYPECNKIGEWKSAKYTKEMKCTRKNEIRKFQGSIAKCVASAAGKRKKRKLKIKEVS